MPLNNGQETLRSAAMMPRRIRWRAHTLGWKKPVNTKYVGRPSPWGNPYKVGRDGTAQECVQLFIAKYEHDSAYRARVRTELAGYDLACWCREDAPWCHANVLLQ